MAFADLSSCGADVKGHKFRRQGQAPVSISLPRDTRRPYTAKHLIIGRGQNTLAFGVHACGAAVAMKRMRRVAGAMIMDNVFISGYRGRGWRGRWR